MSSANPPTLDPIAPTDKSDGPRRRVSDSYWQRAAPDARWLRSWFSRRSLLDGLRTFAWIAPVTVIIWIYAEREQIQKIRVDTSISVISSDRSRFVQPADGAPLKAVLILQGPQVSVEKVRERLTSGIPRGVTIDIADGLPPGPHQMIDVIDRVQNLPDFKENGVTVIESQPAQVAVNVDQILERLVDVQAPPRVDNLTSATTFEPRKVKLRGPKGLLDRLDLKVYADIADSEVLRTPGKKDLPSVPLTLSQPEEGLTIEPPNVHAILDVRAADVAGTIDSIPILIVASPAFLIKFDVKLDSTTLANVHVIGPPDKINLLANQSLTARAILEVLGDSQSRLTFDLPEGVHAAPGETERPVTFKLVPRDNNNG